MTSRILCAGILVVLMAGCGASREQGYLVKAGVIEGEVDAELLAKAEEAWAAREDIARLREALTAFEELSGQKPANRHFLEMLARGYYLLANGYLTEDEEILAAYHTGAGWAERILGLRAEFRKRIEEGADDYEALDVATTEDVPGIYWAYANLGKWSVLKGFTTVLKNKSKLKAFIDRVAALSPDYYHAAADRGLAAFFSKAPSFAGGDLDKAKEHFEKSLQLAPDYFSTKVLMAQYYAVKKQDRALFDKLLNEVVAADPNVVPDALPMQKIEQRNAKKLLAEAEDLFE